MTIILIEKNKYPYALISEYIMAKDNKTKKKSK
jgi:hypothetical protein